MTTNWRNTREYRVWRAGVIRRDKVCQVCGSRQKRNAHHKNHATYFPEERFDLENGVCLCQDCHILFHNKMMGSNRIKCEKKHFERFLLIRDYFKQKG